MIKLRKQRVHYPLKFMLSIRHDERRQYAWLHGSLDQWLKYEWRSNYAPS